MSLRELNKWLELRCNKLEFLKLRISSEHPPFLLKNNLTMFLKKFFLSSRILPEIFWNITQQKMPYKELWQ
jgi:hypothetical protein